LGAGLPPTATYVIGAVIIVQPLRDLGVNPWVAHFFVFLLSVWGELSPPTSLTAAVSARIAEVSFMRTMFEALKICIPITLMTFTIFTRSNMVISPGWLQVADTILVIIGTCGVTFAMFGRAFATAAADMGFRILVAALSLVTLFHPDDTLVWTPGIAVLGLVVFGIWRHRQIAPPKEAAPADKPVTAGDLGKLAAEARRDLG
jgi:TRAP-type uncharacterized transport system fused permease subunit